MDEHAILGAFAASLRGGDTLAAIRNGLIGANATVPGPFGPRRLVYADYIASGRALRQVEDFVLDQVLPYYANSHTEASYCGRFMTRLRREARGVIAQSCGADDRHATIFTGAGATAGLNRLVHLLGVHAAVAAGERPVVLIGPYEHHSNILPWRESGAEIVEIAECPAGGPDPDILDAALGAIEPGRLKIGAFSAASNVTGIVTDTDAVTAILKRHDALAVWDFAAAAPYLPIDMRAGTAFEKDAIVASTHKFPGGPGASGILVVRRDAIRACTPSLSGGGTVRFVSPWGHDFSTDPVAREEAGTPNVVGDVRAALCFIVKDAIGQSVLDARHATLRGAALARWRRNPDLDLLGNPHADRNLPFFAFRVRDRRGGFVHPQLVTRLLSDLHGIQARGGCACAGPYAHRLLEIDRPMSDGLRADILAGREISKPGWTRLNLSALLDDAKAALIIDAVDTIAQDAERVRDAYSVDETTARFRPALAA